MKNNLLLIGSIIAAVALVGGLVLYTKMNEKVPMPIQIEEFSDFQCPYCKNYAPIVKQIKEQGGTDVNFSFRNFPLVSIHDRAYPAAIAAEAAREQGKFDEYHYKLYENQEKLSDEDLKKYAQELGLDMQKFEQDIANNQTIEDRINADMKEGEQKGVMGTPTFYINGKKVEKSPEELLKYLQGLLEKGRAQKR